MSDTGPEGVYGEKVARGDLRADPAQELAVALLQRVFDDLAAERPKPKGLSRLLGRRAKADGVRGLYLWGGVGRGKSMLMDMFYDTMPGDAKRRVHFHAFMADIHDR